jgi:GNAT superfamily N-acetyltransferase
MDGHELAVRSAGHHDIDLLVESNLALARETEGKGLDEARLRAGIRAVLGDRSRGRYFVAERDGTPVGALMVTTEWSDWRDGEFWWIQSVYVTRAARRTGVYRALHAHVEREARATPGVCGLRLYVERENEAAQRTYEAVGMARSHYDLFEVDFVLGDDAPTSRGME